MAILVGLTFADGRSQRFCQGRVPSNYRNGYCSYDEIPCGEATPWSKTKKQAIRWAISFGWSVIKGHLYCPKCSGAFSPLNDPSLSACAIRMLQESLGVPADGIMGPQTRWARDERLRKEMDKAHAAV